MRPPAARPPIVIDATEGVRYYVTNKAMPGIVWDRPRRASRRLVQGRTWCIPASRPEAAGDESAVWLDVTWSIRATRLRVE